MTFFQRTRVIGLPTAILSAKMFFLHGLLMLIPLYFVGLNLSGLEIGLLFGAFNFTTLILTVPFGVFSDKLVPKNLAIIGLVFLLFFAIGLIIAKTFLEFLFLFVIGGFGSNLSMIAIYSLFYKTMGDQEKETRLSILEGGKVIGYGTGIFVGAMLLTVFSFLFFFKIISIAFAILILLAFFLVKTSAIKFSVKEYFVDLRNIRLEFLYVATFLLSLHFGAELTAHTLFLRNSIGLGFQQIAFVFLFIGIVCAASALVGGRIIKATKKLKAVLISTFFLSGLGNVLYFFAFDFYSVLFNRFIHEMGDGAAILSTRIAVAELTPSKRTGGIFGGLSFFTTVGAMIGSILSGYLIDSLGFVFPFVFSGALVLIAIVLFSFWQIIKKGIK